MCLTLSFHGCLALVHAFLSSLIHYNSYFSTFSACFRIITYALWFIFSLRSPLQAFEPLTLLLPMVSFFRLSHSYSQFLNITYLYLREVSLTFNFNHTLTPTPTFNLQLFFDLPSPSLSFCFFSLLLYFSPYLSLKKKSFFSFQLVILHIWYPPIIHFSYSLGSFLFLKPLEHTTYGDPQHTH